MPKRGNGEGSIYPVKDKNGRVKGYRGSYWVHTAGGPKRRYISGRRREDVRDELTKALSDRLGGLAFDAGALTVGDYLDRWMKDVEGTVRESTHQRYGYVVGPHLKPTLGGIKLKDLNPAQLRWFYRDRLDSGLSPASVHKLHVVLHKALKAAVADGLIPRSRGRPEASEALQRGDRPLEPGGGAAPARSGKGRSPGGTPRARAQHRDAPGRDFGPQVGRPRA